MRYIAKRLYFHYFVNIEKSRVHTHWLFAESNKHLKNQVETGTKG